MTVRKIIKIDEDKCNGCGQCIPNCPEGALKVIDGKARLISDLFCDGLGACIGHCPEGAIVIEERDSEPYNERRVMENVVKQGTNVIKAHLAHLKGHGQEDYYREAVDFLREKGLAIPREAAGHGHHGHGHGGCPGSRVVDSRAAARSTGGSSGARTPGQSQLRQWPVQIMLVPPNAPYFRGADILLAADCAPFAYADFHEEFLRGKVLLVGCPKLDDAEFYREKITDILKRNDIKSLTCVHMEVPCCFGLVHLAQEAIAACGKEVPFHDVTIGIDGGLRK